MNLQWIVNDAGELGMLINGQAYFMYKGQPFQYQQDADGPTHYRPVEKREFGESGPKVDPQFDAHDWIELPSPIAPVLFSDLTATIKSMWAKGDRVAAVKLYRHHNGCSLREAKDAVVRLTSN